MLVYVPEQYTKVQNLSFCLSISLYVCASDKSPPVSATMSQQDIAGFFSKVDQDGNGSITVEEFLDLFKRLDKDSTYKELLTHYGRTLRESEVQ